MATLALVDQPLRLLWINLWKELDYGGVDSIKMSVFTAVTSWRATDDAWLFIEWRYGRDSGNIAISVPD